MCLQETLIEIWKTNFRNSDALETKQVEGESGDGRVERVALAEVDQKGVDEQAAQQDSEQQGVQ